MLLQSVNLPCSGHAHPACASNCHFAPLTQWAVSTVSTHTMAEQNAVPTERVIPLTEPPKDGEADGDKGPSKSALKKAQKEKEKVRTSSFLHTTSTLHTRLHCPPHADAYTCPTSRPRKPPSAKPPKTRRRRSPKPAMSRPTTTASCPCWARDPTSRLRRRCRA